MQELLTRGIPGRHKKFKKTPIGEIPAEWEVIRFEKAIEYGPQNGLYRPESDYGSGTYIVRIDNFYDGKFITTKDFKRVNISQMDVELYKLQANDIVINRVNSLSHLGKAAIVPFIGETTVFESNMMRVRLNKKIMLPEYAILWLCTPTIKKQIENSAKKAVAQCSINQTDVKNLVMARPPIEEQRIIIDVISRNENQLEQNQAVLLCLTNLKSALMQVLLTGKVRVKI